MKFLFCACVVGICSALRQVTWSATTRQSLPATPEFRQWFVEEENDVAASMISASDAISDVKDLGNGIFEARVTTGDFPVVTLTPIIVFECLSEKNNGVSVRLKEQRMEVLGPRWATRIVLAASQLADTASCTTFSLRDDHLECEGNIETTFRLPAWVPIPVKMVQNAGQDAIQKQCENDVANMLKNALSNYERSSSLVSQ